MKMIIPKGFTKDKCNEETDEVYEGKVLGMWSAPMEGWDEEHSDSVVVVKTDKGYVVDGYISFGEFDKIGPFKTRTEAEKQAIQIMKDLKDEW